MSICAFNLKDWMIIFLVTDKLLQADQLGTNPYCLLVRKEEQSFDYLRKKLRNDRDLEIEQ